MDRQKLTALFKEIEPQLYRYPAIDSVSFSKAVGLVADATPESFDPRVQK